MRTPIILLLSLLPCFAQLTGDQKKALAQALYTEEVTRDREAAAGQYEKIVEAHRQQRAHAATALFRLAEIRRSQGNIETATELFREYLSAFPDLEPQAKLARGHLADVDASPTEMPPAPTDEETKNLQRLKRFAISAPDVVTDPGELLEAVKKNQLSVLDFLLNQGSDPMKTNALQTAATHGYLEVVKRLVEHTPKVPDEDASQTIFIAYGKNRTAVLNYLLDQGFTTEITIDGKKPKSLLMLACQKNDLPTVEMLLKRGADIDWIATSEEKSAFISPLHTAIVYRNFDLATYLIEKGAAATHTGDFQGEAKNITPLHVAAVDKSPAAVKLVKLLLQKGSDPNQKIEGMGLPIQGPSPRGPIVFRSDLKTAIEAASTPEMIRALVNGGAILDPALLLRKGNDLELLKCLLTLGADPNTPALKYGKNHTVFSELIHSRRAKFTPVLTRAHLVALKEAGAILPTDQFGYDNPLDFVNSKIREDVFDLFILPGLSKPHAITIVDSKSRKSVQIPSPTSDNEPLPTPLVLTAAVNTFQANEANWADPFDDPFRDRSTRRGPLFHPQIQVTRASGDFILDLNAQEKPPTLEFGDVLTLTRIPDRDSNESGFPDDVRWSLKKSINFTVTFIEDGRKSTIAIRGERLAASPDGLIQPYLGGWELVNRLTSKILPPLEIKLTRATGEITTMDNFAREFPLLPGDVIAVTRHVSGNTFDPTKITLFTTGGSFHGTYALDDPKIPVPSLCELLAVTIPSLPASDLVILGQDSEKFAAARSGSIFQAPPAFDLSNIKIIRRNGKALTEIDLDLEASLDTLPDHPTQANLRALDPQLQPGDIIKIASLPVSGKDKWQIFSPKISAFLGSLLKGSVGISLPNNRKAFAALSWSTPEVHLTPFGPIAFRSTKKRNLTIGDLLPAYTEDFGPAFYGFLRGPFFHQVHRHSTIPLRDGDLINATGPNRPGPPARTAPKK